MSALFEQYADGKEYDFKKSQLVRNINSLLEVNGQTPVKPFVKGEHLFFYSKDGQLDFCPIKSAELKFLTLF